MEAGSGFDTGAQVFVGENAAPFKRVDVRACGELRLRGLGLKAMFPRGVPVKTRAVNAESREATVTFMR